MKNSMLIIAGALLLSCQESPEPAVREIATAPGDSGGPLNVRPIEELVGVDISNGLVYLSDGFQGIKLINGQPSCGENIPDGEFAYLQVDQNMGPGLFACPSGDLLALDPNGNFGVVIDFTVDCVTRDIWLPRDDCPQGFLGAIHYRITDCYLGWIKISSDTVEVGSIPCVDVSLPDFGDLHFEGPLGEELINPICL